MCLARYLVRVKEMVKNLKYKQLILPDGEEAVEDESSEIDNVILLDKYRIQMENQYTHYEDIMRNDVLKKIFNEFSIRNEDQQLYSRV